MFYEKRAGGNDESRLGDHMGVCINYFSLHALYKTYFVEGVIGSKFQL